MFLCIAAKILKRSKKKLKKKKMKMLDHVHDKYITTQEFNKLTVENFAARLKQANLASKNDIADFIKQTDFDKKLRNMSKKLIQINQDM